MTQYAAAREPNEWFPQEGAECRGSDTMDARSVVGCLYPLSPVRLLQENRRYRGSKAVSRSNRKDGFRPAFLDLATHIIYPSRQANGSPAAVHCLDGLPEELVAARDEAGCVSRIKPGVIAGFLHEGRFYTREEALQLLQEE